MRRTSIAAILAWVAVAYAFRYHDARPLNTQVYARITAQGGPWAHIAWIEGPTRLSSTGHLVIARVRVDTIFDRSAWRPVPGDARQCRLWFEESREAVQAVASCPGAEPIRLTADNTTLPPLGPVNKPTLLYDLYPLKSFDPQWVIDAVHPRRPSHRHPLLAALALLAFLPLALIGRAGLRRARVLDRLPSGEGDLPGEPAGRVRRAAQRDLLLGGAGLLLALLFSLGLV